MQFIEQYASDRHHITRHYVLNDSKEVELPIPAYSRALFMSLNALLQSDYALCTKQYVQN